MYTATYRTVCYGWRVGIVKSIVIVTATAAPNCDLTYLTYLLILLTIPYPPIFKVLVPSKSAKEKRNEHRHRHCLESRYAYLNYYKQLPCYIILP